MRAHCCLKFLLQCCLCCLVEWDSRSFGRSWEVRVRNSDGDAWGEVFVIFGCCRYFQLVNLEGGSESW
ncbi:hypothetical protein KC19_1G009500 [Ceratodon purpureus]|uniref:Secreted protein n=1 Tax=Ceratodon purpureus TaxID=3225 RepID=A0A8T0J2B9_CERPU|nr:hypothetical protein KC19_1G009500 [Ceratodon purpureus]